MGELSITFYSSLFIFPLMPPPSRIALDGPVASGKSAVGKRLAQRLGYLFFDTGLLYRAITFLALRQFGSVADAAKMTTLAIQTHLEVTAPTVNDGRDCTVLADGEDITLDLRRQNVEAHVSPVAAMPPVRRLLTQQMRRVGLRGQVVMVGRDVGTVILPEAELKVFITASVEVRAQRRFLEAQARGETRTYADILANLRDRDRIDSTRATAPLRAAADAIQLDTTALNLEGVVAEIMALVEK
jgi:cytidylate kinase